MTTEKLTPSGSQTVGPYFHIGLEHLMKCAQAPEKGTTGAVKITGLMLDCDGAPVPDAMLEFWCADSTGSASNGPDELSLLPTGFNRVATDLDGRFALETIKPRAIRCADGRFHAPHFIVLVFARGLLRHLITRVYFADEVTNGADPVLLEIPEDRRPTLIARSDDHSEEFCWNVILQGKEETVFFDW